MQVTITKPDVFSQYGILMPLGSTQTVDTEFGMSLVQAQKAIDTDAIEGLPNNTPYDTYGRAVLTTSQLLALAQTGTPIPAGTLLISPTTRLIYGQSDGIGDYQPLGGGVVTLPSGLRGFIDPITSNEYPLDWIGGARGEPTLTNGSISWEILFDAGSDIDHPEILYTLDCDTGTPGTPDNVIASQRFTVPNEEVTLTGMGGATAGRIVPMLAGSIRLIHFAFAGAGPYTVNPAVSTVSLLQMVPMILPAGTILAELTFGTSYTGGGVNKRFRKCDVYCYMEP
jgi:hypothetical protein